MEQQMMRTLSNHRIEDNRFEMARAQMQPNSPIASSEKRDPYSMLAVDGDEDRIFESYMPSIIENSSYKDNDYDQAPGLNENSITAPQPMAKNDSIVPPLPV
jgi:hypothetical protein